MHKNIVKKNLDKSSQNREFKPHYKYLNAFVKAAPTLKIKPYMVEYISYLFKFSNKRDWEDGMVLVWTSNQKIKNDLSISQSSCLRRLQKAIDLKLINRIGSAKKKRWGKRDENLHLIAGEGINLIPLKDNFESFLKIIDSEKNKSKSLEKKNEYLKPSKSEQHNSKKINRTNTYETFKKSESNKKEKFKVFQLKNFQNIFNREEIFEKICEYSVVSEKFKEIFTTITEKTLKNNDDYMHFIQTLILKKFNENEKSTKYNNKLNLQIQFKKHGLKIFDYLLVAVETKNLQNLAAMFFKLAGNSFDIELNILTLQERKKQEKEAIDRVHSYVKEQEKQEKEKLIRQKKILEKREKILGYFSKDEKFLSLWGKSKIGFDNQYLNFKFPSKFLYDYAQNDKNIKTIINKLKKITQMEIIFSLGEASGEKFIPVVDEKL